ncbi:hypothetical protein ENBRE01_2233 [Enteropsectra breve]|nr:hypothetical protein ENBRE01_1231 [Enteropsectra breve]KAI5151579.1 hypothetical protein ENBRE01_2233 [Enteropsectra breve]
MHVSSFKDLILSLPMFTKKKKVRFQLPSTPSVKIEMLKTGCGLNCQGMKEQETKISAVRDVVLMTQDMQDLVLRTYLNVDKLFGTTEEPVMTRLRLSAPVIQASTTEIPDPERPINFIKKIEYLEGTSSVMTVLQVIAGTMPELLESYTFDSNEKNLKIQQMGLVLKSFEQFYKYTSSKVVTKQVAEITKWLLNDFYTTHLKSPVQAIFNDILIEMAKENENFGTFISELFNLHCTGEGPNKHPDLFYHTIEKYDSYSDPVCFENELNKYFSIHPTKETQWDDENQKHMARYLPIFIQNIKGKKNGSFIDDGSVSDGSEETVHNHLIFEETYKISTNSKKPLQYAVDSIICETENSIAKTRYNVYVYKEGKYYRNDSGAISYSWAEIKKDIEAKAIFTILRRCD